MKKELRFWSYLILCMVIGEIVAVKTIMLVMDVLIRLDVSVWAEIVILGVVFISVFALVFRGAIFAIDTVTVLIEENKFKVRKDQ